LRWMDSYLSELERATGRDVGSIERPRSWSRKNSFDKWPDDNLPMIIIICSNLAARPTKTGSGRYRAPWAVGIAVVVSSQDEESTRNLAGLYAAAIRAIMIQHQSLDGSIEGTRGVEWLDERYGELPSEEARTVAAARLVFSVDFDDVVTHGAGPVGPPPDQDPVADWPEITDVNINITKEALNAAP
jgi:hypothetical protein